MDYEEAVRIWNSAEEGPQADEAEALLEGSDEPVPMDVLHEFAEKGFEYEPGVTWRLFLDPADPALIRKAKGPPPIELAGLTGADRATALWEIKLHYNVDAGRVLSDKEALRRYEADRSGLDWRS